MIDLRRLSYSYPGSDRPALQDVTLHVEGGEFVLVAGPSGAGKSTLLRCLNGLVPHFTGGTLTGTVTVAGHDPVAEGPRVLSRVVGFVFQDPEAQFVVDRVEDEIAFALENRAMSRKDMQARVSKTLDLLDLQSLRDRPLDTLSGGQKQRVAIAAALALEPAVLVLDEPTSQLDADTADEVLDAVVRLHRQLNLTVVLAEHRLERILPYASRMVYVPWPDAAVVSGLPRDVLRAMDDGPPVVALGKLLGWDPLPVTVDEARALVATTSPGGTSPRTPHVRRRTTATDHVLRVETLRFSYDGTPALTDVSIDVRRNELVALLGRNGSGKTTLLRCIVGLLRPDAGTVTLNGESIVGRDPAEICQTVGYLPQTPDHLLFADTVQDELGVTLRNHHKPEKTSGETVELLEQLDLADVATRYPRDLSVGQRQRVALGAITVVRPRLLLLDEPTRGLDYAAKRRLAQLLGGWRTHGLGILLVTHDVEFAAQVADRVVILHNGRQVAAGPLEQVLISCPLVAPQMARLFPDAGWLTVEDAVNGLKKTR